MFKSRIYSRQRSDKTFPEDANILLGQERAWAHVEFH